MWPLFLHKASSYCLVSFDLTCRITFIIFRRTDLVVTIVPSFCFLWDYLNFSPHFWKTILAGYRFLADVLPFSTLNISAHCLLTSKAFEEEFVNNNLVKDCLYVNFFLLLHSGLSYCLWLLIFGLSHCMSWGHPSWCSLRFWIYVHISHQTWEIFDHVFKYSLCSFLFSSGTPIRYMLFCIMMTHSFLMFFVHFFLYISSFPFVPQTQFLSYWFSSFSNMLWIFLVNFISVIL